MQHIQALGSLLPNGAPTEDKSGMIFTQQCVGDWYVHITYTKAVTDTQIVKAHN